MCCGCHQDGAAPAASYNDEWLAGVVDQLSEFDRDMNTVVVDSGILTGIPSGALARAGQRINPQLCASRRSERHFDALTGLCDQCNLLLSYHSAACDRAWRVPMVATKKFSRDAC